MAYEVSIDARYPRDADTVFAEAMQFAEVIEAMRGLAHYDGLPGVWPSKAKPTWST